ncbi:glycosyltransferase [Actinokineospora enzanensis]|uniref:glycosyltransferase n=1 Tax=Actinokineospora enzanensis TaxID=155975 RepID=UPI000380BE1A|nr:glycosyltransferase [Actinokineospora enzanensis]
MKILFSSLPSHGHTYPLLPLAVAARDQGHEIIYATWDNFHPPLVALGFEVVRGGGDMNGAFADALAGVERPASGTHAQLDEGVIRAAAVRVFGELLPRAAVATVRPLIAERRPDLVVYESGAIGVGIAARAEGVPALCHGFGRGGGLDELPGMKEWLGALAADNGVEFAINAGHPGSDPYLDIYPLSAQDPAYAAKYTTRVPLRPTAFAEPGELPDWVAEHREKLIYLTLGTAFGSSAVMRAAIRGLAATGHRVLVAAGPTVPVDSLGASPDNVTVLPWVPQAEVLPHADLVAHHGGSGTTLGTAAAGIPQLFLPQGADQFINADAITGTGAARQLAGEAQTAKAITALAGELLTDTAVAECVRALADEIAAMPSPAETAATLSTYV